MSDTNKMYDEKELEACIRGFYSNSFFHIYTKGEFNLDVSKIARQKDKGTAQHEYTHYIQNIGTLWGLYCSIFNYETIIQFKKAVYEATEIVRPFAIPTTESLKRKALYVKHGNGTIGYPKWNLKDEESIDYVLTPINVNGHERTQTDLTITLTDGTKKTIQLGAHIIKESMAALYQSLIDPDAEHDDVPYNLVRKLAEKCFPKTAEDVRKLICCCHTSLFSMSPGSSLIELLEEAETRPYMTGFQLFERYVRDKVVEKGSGEKKPIMDFFNDMVDGFKKMLSINLVSPLDYIATVLERVRLDGRFYPFLSVLYEKEAYTEKDFTDIIGYYGIPYIQTSNFGYYFPQGQSDEGKHGSIDVLELIAQEALYRNFVDKERMSVCPLYYMCRDSKFVKDECFDKPWEGSMCSYTIVSDMLKLREKKIV